MYHKRVEGERGLSVTWPMVECGGSQHYESTMGSWDDIDCPKCLDIKLSEYDTEVIEVRGCRACGKAMEEHPYQEMESPGVKAGLCEYFVDPDTNGIGSEERSSLHGLPTGGYTDAAYEAPTLTPMVGSDAWKALYPPEPYIQKMHAADAARRLVEERKAEIARVQPAFRRAWTGWECGWGPQRWYRDDSHPAGGFFRSSL